VTFSDGPVELWFEFEELSFEVKKGWVSWLVLPKVSCKAANWSKLLFGSLAWSLL
jgi:hypothetical protein